MEIFIGEQLKNIAYSSILGLIFGAFYDIICIIHIIVGILSFSGNERHPDRIFSRNPAARAVFFVTDSIYMLAVTVMLSVFLYEFAYGDLRMYLLIAAAAGFSLYHYTIGRLVMACSETIVRMIRCVIRCTIIRPVCIVLRFLKRMTGWLYRRTLGRLLQWILFCCRLQYLECVKKKLAQEIRFDGPVSKF